MSDAGKYELIVTLEPFFRNPLTTSPPFSANVFKMAAIACKYLMIWCGVVVGMFAVLVSNRVVRCWQEAALAGGEADCRGGCFAGDNVVHTWHIMGRMQCPVE